MMAETKGRGGKKPKYQIADIGGDLTSEDISTERVLNFLIKGGMGTGEQSDPPAGSTGSETTIPSPAPSPAQPISPSDEASSEQPVKKSLSHLFERAGSGGGPAKDLKLKLSEHEEASVPSPPLTQQPIVTESVTSAGLDETSNHPEVLAPLPESLDEATLESTPTKSIIPNFDLTPYIDLWKNFYRLKSGEIEALSSLFRMSHGEGRTECHVKMHNLAEMSNLDYRYCQKVVRSLERLGWITKLQDYDPVTRLGMLYRVNLKPTQVI